MPISGKPEIGEPISKGEDRSWLAQHKDEIEIFYLPACSQELFLRDLDLASKPELLGAATSKRNTVPLPSVLRSGSRRCGARGSA